MSLVLVLAGCAVSSATPDGGSYDAYYSEGTSTPTSSAKSTPQPRSTRVSQRSSPPKRRAARAKPRRPRPQPASASDAVVLYVSPWCMHCKPMEKQLRDEGIPFVKRDIFDRRYTEAYVAKMSEHGFRPPAVPVVDMKGTLVVGLDKTTVSWTWRALQAGRKPERPHVPGGTSPPTPRDPAYTPGTQFVEPPAAPAILYVSDWCPHCPAARKFLRSRKIKWVEKDVNKPGVEAELAAHNLTLWINDGRTVPSILLFDRILRGFDKDSVDNMLAWRKRK